mmetsp:Transcript_29797/g.44045  ORF Transcript_29797/g.44045 Transcript_29797/m.44045 type:complete len:139 (+) Transcript_29797:287-703(+)|eukprot:CAMPEP_0194203804 /NCGR_PEP_ID=MMETSP0156-20130528/3478_1 /TAXON_ID=33649 /ORGANISM="Thalassionema nitzschioides, Strain L26-B" /LENGTH=138 /DNA_ID=CAMNT_0038929635 /DNA_START=1209 /DNA_END=1625 /DNA_ORIENTATION=+
MKDTTLPLKKSIKKNGGVKEGFGLKDWQCLLKSSRDLAQRKGAPIREMTMKEVNKHNKVFDGWMALNEKVYNIAPYLAYHPGGSGIMKPYLGRDGSAIFSKHHPWVNIEELIGPLLIGYLKGSKSLKDSEERVRERDT